MTTADVVGGKQPDREELHLAIEAADLRVLLMCLVHITGNLKWLEPPFQPSRDVRLVADPTAGLAPEAQARIRSAAHGILAGGVPSSAIPNPSPELLHRMMNVCLGETVGAEYVSMMREDMGFESGDAVWASDPTPAELARFSVVIVGAGIFGMALAAKLEALGFSYSIIEKNAEVGGTWFENRYPGCGVDTPNHFYSYSFAPSYLWSHYFSSQGEVLEYLVRCADEAGIRRNIRFDTRVTGAEWDDNRKMWRLTVEGPDGGKVIESNVLISAIGQFNEPSIPYIVGLDDFDGPLFHSAKWSDEIELGGKHVAIIGTGASAMQIAPTIASDVRSLTVYQRSPQWARPVPEYKQEVKAGSLWLLQHVPFYALWTRFTLFWRFGDGLLPFIRKDPTWPHSERSVNRVNDRHRRELTEFMYRELMDRPALLEQCVPTYPPYGKRMLIDNGWFRTLTLPNVHLVTRPITRIVQDGIITDDGQHRAVDVVVMATGFKMSDMTARLGIVGQRGKPLAEAWSDDNPTAYLGMSVPGFPNLFIMFGPNTNLGHGGSLVFHAECQARYISKILVAMTELKLAAVECKPAVHDEYVARVDAAHEELIWTHPGMTTYYRNARGRVIAVSPWRLVDYWTMTHAPNLDDFDLVS